MCTAMSSSHGSGSGSVVGGSGPQSNLKGSGNDHEKRHYGPSQDLQVIAAEKLRSKKEAILRSLHFPNMDSRRQNIEIAYPKTCEWLMNTAQFDEWWDDGKLPNHNGVLWIKGEPGAGKSTLMKYTLERSSRKAIWA